MADKVIGCEECVGDPFPGKVIHTDIRNCCILCGTKIGCAEPALTKELWEEYADDTAWFESLVSDAVDSISGLIPSKNDRHALAALCLRNQPFGFTRRDWADCADTARRVRAFDYESARALYDLADRIEALLPPE